MLLRCGGWLLGVRPLRPTGKDLVFSSLLHFFPLKIAVLTHKVKCSEYVGNMINIRWASLVDQMAKNQPAMRETWV